MHRSLKHSLSFGNRRASLEAQQTWFDSYRREFNQERPHEALGGLTPGGIWVPSPRRWDGKTPEVSYPEGARLYRVRTKGDIYIGKRLFLNQALRGEYVMLEERDDGLEAIIFNQMDLAYYDRRKQSIIRID